MHAVEFQTTITNGTIELPAEWKGKLVGTIRVILLTEGNPAELEEVDLMERAYHLANQTAAERGAAAIDQICLYQGKGLPWILYRAATDTFENLDSTGPLLGTLETATFKERQVEIRAGDILTLYTDGITESMNTAMDLFGEDRLKDVVRSRRDGPAAEIARAIRETVSAFSGGEPQDDLTLVIVKGKP